MCLEHVSLEATVQNKKGCMQLLSRSLQLCVPLRLLLSCSPHGAVLRGTGSVFRSGGAVLITDKKLSSQL